MLNQPDDLVCQDAIKCPLAELCLTREQEKALAEMRLMERIGKGGGMIKLYWDGKTWRITAIRGGRGGGDSSRREN